ncbi:unnamed protein product [Litomosoides sigmodontis]|uniref:Low molecular weight phosphotyrosine protein phosphatase n=1 Tax=Litomosoides sigmodontis TaxID=42156 RepID=A0A3P6S9P1_LITSI|nr:unnamed protein product [Litomosoides sigmodontis]
MTTLANHGITDYRHVVRQVTDIDFDDFDYIFGMDHRNIEHLNNLRPNVESKAIIDYLGSYDPKGVLVIPDPFYSRGMQVFEKVYQHCLRCCQAFLEKNS